jgi:dTMP kinase
MHKMKPGRLIAVEGIDGSGKGTQCQMLFDALRRSGVSAELLQFPQYESSFFGAEVGRYLHGDFGQLRDVHPKFSALLYALDRFEARDRLIAALGEGKVVICDRYTPSNVAHQSARTDVSLRSDMSSWIQHVEYHVLGLPKPDVVFLLDSTVHTSQTLVSLKDKRAYTNKTHDIQEASGDHLQAALDEFRVLASNPGWIVINCIAPDGALRTPSEIHAELLAYVTGAIK